MLKDSELQRDAAVDTEYVRMYYEHQYDRMAELEGQRLTITNIVITLSIVAFTFGFSNVNNVNVITGLGLPVVMFIANTFAILYILRSADWITLHRDRARRVIQFYAKDLHNQIAEPMTWPYDIEHRKRNFWVRLWVHWFTRGKIQLYIHIVLLNSGGAYPSLPLLAITSGGNIADDLSSAFTQSRPTSAPADSGFAAEGMRREPTELSYGEGVLLSRRCR